MASLSFKILSLASVVFFCAAKPAGGKHGPGNNNGTFPAPPLNNTRPAMNGTDWFNTTDVHRNDSQNHSLGDFNLTAHNGSFPDLNQTAPNGRHSRSSVESQNGTHVNFNGTDVPKKHSSDGGRSKRGPGDKDRPQPPANTTDPVVVPVAARRLQSAGLFRGSWAYGG